MSSSGDETQYEYNSADESDTSEEYEEIDFDSDDEDDEADLSYDVLEESINTDDSDSEADDLRSCGEVSLEKAAKRDKIK